MLLAIVGGLTLIAVSLAGRDFVVGANHLMEMSKLKSDTRVIWRFFDAVEAASAERNVSIMAYNSGPTPDPIVHKGLAESRARARATMAIALAEIKTTAALTALFPRIEKRAAEIDVLRAALDDALAHPLAAKGPALAKQWMDATEDLEDQGDALWTTVLRPHINVYPAVTRNLRASHFLRLMYDYSGRVRSMATPIILGAPFSREEMFNLQHIEGARNVSWDAGILIIQQTGLYPAMENQVADAKRDCQTVQDVIDLVAADETGTITHPGARQWFAISQKCQRSLDALQRASRQAMIESVATATASVSNDTLVSGAVLFTAVFICIASLWIISRHVVMPFRVIIQTLENAAAGGAVAFTWKGAVSTEVAKLVHILLSLQEAMASAARRAEEIDRSERTLRAVVDNAMDGIVTVDDQGIVKTFNPASEHMFGYAENDIVGHHVSLLLPNVSDGLRGPQFQQLDPAGRLRAAIAARQMTAVSKTGTRFPIELSVSTFETADGRFHTAIIRDITARKQVEADLAAYTEALERSNKELDDFAYIASHDLKEPLRGIHNHARFLLEDNEKTLPEESVKRLNRLVYLSKRMEHLVSDLLYFSRLGRHQLAIQQTDMNALVADVVGTLECFIAENDANVAVEDLPWVRCDSIRIAEVFRNLITNAVKYNTSADKRIEIGIACDKPEPHGGIAHQAFFVRDNGCGIAPEFHEEVFRIFRRLHASASEKDGTGVGLTFVKKIIERHGGEVWVESTPGQGATFYFTLEPVYGAHESAGRAA